MTSIQSPAIDEVKVDVTTLEVKIGESQSALAAIPSVSINDLTTDPQMIGAFRQFGYGKPSIEAMARFINFGDDDIDLINIFMKPDFDESWFYLSPAFIVDRIGYNSPKAFNKVLDKSYVLGDDYKKISVDDELVKEWSIQDPAGSQIPGTPKRGGQAKPRAVKGRVIKDVLQQSTTAKAKQVRLYFVKIEGLVRFMDKYIGLFHLYISEQRRIEVERRYFDQSVVVSQLKAQTKDLDQRADLLKQFIKARAIRRPTGYLYIATTQADHSVNRFKIGVTTNLELRLGVYNKTFTNSVSRVYYCDYFAVHDHAIVEKLVGIHLKPYHLVSAERVKQDESYIVNLTYLHSTVASICAQHMSMVETANERLNVFEADINLPSPAMRRDLPASQLAIEMKACGLTESNLADPSPADEATLCSYVINKLVRGQNYPTFNWPADKDEELAVPVRIKWNDIHKCVKEKLPRGQQFPANVWKPRFQSTLDGAKSITYRAYSIKAGAIAKTMVGP